MADSTLQIIVGGNGDAALAVLQRIADGVDSLSEKVKRVNPPEAPDAKNALQQLEDHLVSLQGLPGPLGEGIRAVTSAISEMGVVGEAAGAAVDGALSPVLITVGLIIVAVAALAVSIAGLIAESENLVNMAAAWSSQVRAFQSLTGATAEYASTLLYVPYFLSLILIHTSCTIASILVCQWFKNLCVRRNSGIMSSVCQTNS